MSTPAEAAVVHPCAEITGAIRVPGDKSISHRLAMLAALAEGTSSIEGFLNCEDCLSTLSAMTALGARSTHTIDGAVRVEGTAGKMQQPSGRLDVGNSGTTIRLLSGLLAGQQLTVELTGDASLCRRPMKRIQEPLERMGAQVELLGDDGRPPIRVHGGGIRGMEYTLPVASAQVKSCILLAGLYAEGPTVVHEPRATRNHTERLLKAMGVDVNVEDLRIEIAGLGPSGPPLKARAWAVPGDFSSAAFPLLAAAGKEGSRLTLQGVGLNPRRTAFLEVLKRMGASIEITPAGAGNDVEPAGEVTIAGTMLRGTAVSGDEIPNLIDELPLVAVAGALAEGRTEIRDAAELRHKESDRIAAMAVNLVALGVEVEERPDGMIINGPARLTGGQTVQSFGDHRIAMAMAILALFGNEPVRIENVACTETSYPGFWDDLKSLGVHVE